MRRIVYGALLCCLFLLMLSTLVVVPEMPAQPRPMPSPQDMRAVFRPLVSAALPDAPAVPENASHARQMVSAPAPAQACMRPPLFTRDANGRVLTALRYENSVHQLFRPETAGG